MNSSAPEGDAAGARLPGGPTSGQQDEIVQTMQAHPVLRILLIATAYFIAGMLGTLLAPSPNFASPLWPAAGIALAALLVGSTPCAVGVWLGAFAVNLAVSPSPDGFGFAGVVATGATMQALSGAWLARRFMQKPARLTTIGNLANFLMLIGPVACLVSSSIGIASGLLFERIATQDAGGEWLAWWAGDTLGVLLIAPVCLLAWAPLRSLWARNGALRIALPLLVTAVMIVGANLGMYSIDQRRETLADAPRLDEVFERGLLSISSAIAPLRSVERFMVASGDVTRDDFEQFTRWITVDPAVVAIDWAPRVRRAERADFEAGRAQDRGARIIEPGDDGRMRAAYERPEYFPVLYSEPSATNMHVLGLDHAYDVERRIEMEQARTARGINVTPVAIAVRTGRVSFLAYVAVFADRSDGIGAHAMRDLRGYVVGVFDLERLFAPLVESARSHAVAIRISDVSGGARPRVLLDRLPPGAIPGLTREVDFGGRSLRLELSAQKEAPGRNASPELMLFYVFAVAGAFLVAFVALNTAGHAFAVDKEVAERTEALRRELIARQEAEEALQRSEERYRRFIESAPFGMLVQVEGRFVYANPKALELFAAQAEADMVGHATTDFVHPEDRDRVRERNRALAAGLLPGPPLELRYLRADGSFFFGESAAVPVQYEGMQGTLVLVQDVTARREAEAQFDRFFDLSPDLQCIGRTNGRFTRVNRAFTQVLGWSAEELLAMPLMTLIHPADRSETKARLERMDEGEGIVAYENRCRCKNGGWRRLAWTARALPGGVVFATAHDTTALHEAAERQARLNDELKRASEDAMQASRAKSAFLAAMSHEIRTPMNGIIGLAEVLALTPLTEQQADLVRTMRGSSASLLRILDDVLDFSKIEAGRLELERAPVAVADLVEGLCASLAPVANQQDVDLSVFVSPDVPPQVLADETRLRQVLYNLASNGIKFSSGRPGLRGHVSVRVVLASAAPLRLRFEVLDNGIGIARDKLDHLFEPFTQAEVSTTRRYGGTGLGLAICKRLVDLMQGAIVAESLVGAGSVFTVELPLEPVPDAPATVYADLDGVACILICADARAPRASDLRAYLEAAGAKVEIARDEAAAEQLVAARGGDPVVVECAEELASDVAGGTGLAADRRRLHISHGRRRRPRIVGPRTVSLDGDALRRSTLLRAVAIAAERCTPDAFDGQRTSTDAMPEISAPTVAEACSQGRLILVAEDDPINQKVILHQLKLLGHAAEVASDGEEALRMWREGRYALLLTDLHMPRMDGYELTRRVREAEGEGRHVPVLALTANALRGDASLALDAGVDEYLTKPLQLKLLQDALARWLPLPPEDGGASADAPVLDLDVMRRLLPDDEAGVRELLGEYEASLRHTGAEMRAAHARGDVEAMVSFAHRLKSSSRAAGALALGDLCAELENAGRAGNAAALTEWMAKFDAATSALLARLAEERGGR